MKKTVIKGIAFVVIFVISLVVISMVANQGNGDMTAPMSAASLPTMAIVEDGQEINQMSTWAKEELSPSEFVSSFLA